MYCLYKQLLCVKTALLVEVVCDSFVTCVIFYLIGALTLLLERQEQHLIFKQYLQVSWDLAYVRVKNSRKRLFCVVCDPNM